MTAIFNQIKPHLIALVIFVLAAVIFCLPQFQGKQMQMGDIVNYKRMSHEAVSYEKKTGEVALWTNALFGGMPTYQISAPARNNLMKHVDKICSVFVPRPAGYFIIGMIGFYLMMIVLGANHWLAIIAAISFAFTTNNFVIFEAGHTSKVKTLMYIAPLIAGVILCYRKSFLKGGLLFSVAFALNVYCNHPQMTFYLGIILLGMVIMYLIQALKTNTIPDFIKASVILLIGALLGVGTSASKLWTTYEYGQDTMRGKPILTQNIDPSSSSSQDGLAWNYAMVFSNSGKDLMSMVVPLAVGGGSQEMLGKESAFAKDLKKLGVNTRKGIPAPTYWGDLSINGGPIYMGAIVIFLLFLSFFSWKSSLKIWGACAIGVTLLFSLGENASFWNKLFFDYFPLFNKFRTPNSVIGVTSILVPMIAFLGLDNYLKSENKKNWHLYASLGLSGGFCLLLALLGSSIFDFSSAGDLRMAQAGYPMDSIIDDRISMQRSSALKSFGLILFSFAMLFLHNKGKIKSLYVIVINGLLCFGDLFMTGKRYLNEDSFVKERNYKQNFTPRPVDEQILRDTDPNYRVLDLSINTFNSSQASYFHKTIGGYHAAKLQRFEDIRNHHINNNNQKVLNMLNTKYIISPSGENQATVQRNPAALGNAWFVNNIIEVSSADEEIDALNDFDPLGDVIVHKEFSDYVRGLTIQKEGSIKLDNYSPNKLEYSSNSNSEQLAVFSEVWYGPNKGWQAKIDGTPVEHIRTNYILRGLKIPAGNHKITFEFNPSTYRTGELISLICSIVLILGLIGFLFLKLTNNPMLIKFDKA